MMGRVTLLPAILDDISRNLDYREYLARRCAADSDWREAVFLRCASDLIWWVAHVAWCHDPKRDGNTDVALIPWPFQREFMLWVDDRIRLQDGGGVIEKTREQAGTWSIVSVMQHWWLFRPDANFLVASRKQEMVDGKDMDAIMPKFDYQIRRMQECGFDWMIPDGYRLENKALRSFLIIKNPVTGCVIKGESTNRDLSRGGRKKACFVDESAAIPFLGRVVSSLGFVTNCPLYLSTHMGAGTEFAKLAAGGNFKKYKLYWHNHPMWQDGVYLCQPGCVVHPDGGKKHSARFDAECRKLNWDPIRIASEIEMDIVRSGNTVFDPSSISAARAWIESNNPQLKHKRLLFEQTGPVVLATADRSEWFAHARKWRVLACDASSGPLRVWKEPFSCTDEECLCKGTGQHVYVAGGDVSKGLKRRDKSILYILDATIGALVAEWAGIMDPDDLGVEWAKVCKYYGTSSGGKYNAFAGIEWNNNGDVVIKSMDQMGIWLQRSKTFDRIINKWQDRIGIVVTAANKGPALIFGQLVPAIRQKVGVDKLPLLCVPFVEFWEECETFVIVEPSEEGVIEPEKVRMGAARGHHDDRVMAAAHALYTSVQRYGKWRGVVDFDSIKEHENGRHRRCAINAG
ncbi:MAG: hypothetical protein N2111_13915 [Candidatus Sumerlaeaceae bacterium]|nr:hypothetical protein [Candidatus Sumerlaeaceae bacterium]